MCTAAYCPCVQVDFTLWDSEQWTEVTDRDFTGVFEMFEPCYQNLLKRKVVEYIDERVIQMVYKLETEFECTGLCSKPMFWFTKDVSL